MFKEPSAPTPKSKKDLAAYNPFTDSLTAAAKRAEALAAAQAPVLDVEEKTKPFPGIKTARELPVTQEEEIIEGELVVEETPAAKETVLVKKSKPASKLPPEFQTHSEVVQEASTEIQANLDAIVKSIGEIELDDPGSITEGTRNVLATLLADDVAKNKFAEYLALPGKKTDLERIAIMESLFRPEVIRAASAENVYPHIVKLREKLNKFFLVKNKISS